MPYKETQKQLSYFIATQNQPYCHTRTQLTIPDCLIIILDDQLGPLVALKSSSYRPAGRPTTTAIVHIYILGYMLS